MRTNVQVNSPAAQGPLAGIRIVDLSTTFMGPVATMHLGRMGAGVIKIESPAGDPPRYNGKGRSHGGRRTMDVARSVHPSGSFKYSMNVQLELGA